MLDYLVLSRTVGWSHEEMAICDLRIVLPRADILIFCYMDLAVYDSSYCTEPGKYPSQTWQGSQSKQLWSGRTSHKQREEQSKTVDKERMIRYLGKTKRGSSHFHPYPMNFSHEDPAGYEYLLSLA